MDLLHVLKERRDTRHFLKEEIDFGIIEKGLVLANEAPSVGLTNATIFIIIESDKAKLKVKSNFEKTNKIAAESVTINFKQNQYKKLKLEGISEAPLGMIVCCDTSVLTNFTIGTITKPLEMLIASSTCAVHTFWLYITSQGLSLGWVSILDFELLKTDFELPTHYHPIGYFCIGKPATNYNNQPMLINEDWAEAKKHTIMKF